MVAGPKAGAYRLRQSICLVECRFHARPALERRRFGSAGAAPVCLEAGGKKIALALQRGELALPVDDALPDRGPVVAFAAGCFCDVLAMAVADTFFWQ